MGAATSKADGESAYHILQVTPNSPGEKAGLVSFFDFILSANNQVLNKDDSTFVDILSANVDQPVKLQVYNALQNVQRDVILTPSRDWGGPGLAGINVRMNNINKTLSLVWHVVHVHPNGPASAAGLQSGSDYIVGVPGLLFFDPDDFYNLVKVNLNKPLALYIYSTQTRNIRVVSVTPDHNWGGNGFLGCDVAYGLNHQLLVALKAGEAPPPAQSTILADRSPVKAHNADSTSQHIHSASVQSSAPPQPHSLVHPDIQHNHRIDVNSESSPKPETAHKHVHGPNCQHGHSHDHPKPSKHEHHDHKHNHVHKHEQGHKHGPNCNHQHSHTSSPSHAPSTPSKGESAQPSTPTTSKAPLPATPTLTSVPVQYSPSQLFSPFQKLPEHYYATPIPEDLLEGEEPIPFQPKFGY
jgi:hypothetical protein